MNEIDDEAGTGAYLGKDPKWLRQQRWLDGGPPFVKVGRAVRYRRVDVDRWLEANTVRPSGTAA